MKIGLALGGGGIKGLALIGALKFLEEQGIQFDIISGTSVGSIVGALIAKEFISEEMYAIGKNMSLTKLLDINLPLKGISKKDKLKKFLRLYLKGNIEDLKIKFIASATNIKTGLPEFIEKGNLVNAVCASSSISGVFNPEEINGKTLIDGGFSSSLPVNILRKKGADKIISINLLHHDFESTNKFINNITYSSLMILEDNLSRLEEENADIKIRIPTGKYSIFSVKNPQELYDLGYNSAKKCLKEIKQLISNK